MTVEAERADVSNWLASCRERNNLLHEDEQPSNENELQQMRNVMWNCPFCAKGMLAALLRNLRKMTAKAEKASPVQMTSTGGQSPVVSAGGDVMVTYGLPREEWEGLLRQLGESIVKKMRDADDNSQRFLLEQELQAVQGKRANIEKSYQEELMRRKAADEALGRLQGQLPQFQIEKAQDALRQGDAASAEQAFDEVVEKVGGSVAMAAHQSGQLAEGRLDYDKAMRQYRKAAALEEDNPDYLLAAGCMARTLGDYAQAQNWLEQLMKIRVAQGQEDVDFAQAMYEIAGLYQSQGKYEQAEPLYQRSLEIREKSLGADHPDVATALNDLAGLYCRQGKYEKAKPLCKRSLTILKAKFPDGHPTIDIVQGNYGLLQKNSS